MRTLLASVVLALAALAGPGIAQADAAADPLRSVQWALDAIHLGPAQPAAAGSGALVAIIDSGVEATHPDLAGRVVAGPDFVDGGAPDDPTGHGTHIAGIVAAAAGNGVGVAGVAPQARIFAVRVLGPDDNGSAANVAAGINAAVDAGADVINLSLNWASATQELAAVKAAMQRAVDAGALLVVAAGNGALGRCEEPILPQRSLCVGALSSDLKLAPFSSHGQGLGLVAPGDDLMSTWRGGEYQSMSGTSQAAAVTSGVAAMLVGLGIRGDELLKRLVSTARDIGAPGVDSRTGAGLLDAQRALDGAAQHRMPAMLSIGSASRATARSMSRRGLRVTCDAARAGVCKIRIRAGGSIIARGSAAVDGTGAFDIVARPTAAGRRLLGARRAMSGVVDATLGVARVRRALAVSGG